MLSNYRKFFCFRKILFPGFYPAFFKNRLHNQSLSLRAAACHPPSLPADAILDYVGCYHDHAERILPHFAGSFNAGNTPGSCAARYYVQEKWRRSQNYWYENVFPL